MLEFIHLFVEVLDQYFGSVCELDLVFNFYKVYQILDEMVVGGEVMETSKLIVNRSLKNTDYYDWTSKTEWANKHSESAQNHTRNKGLKLLLTRIY